MNEPNYRPASYQASNSPAALPYVSPGTLSDKELYIKCREYGGNAKNWLRKFAGLLPEVFRRSLHRQHGCGSIHEFARKLSGMNERTVKKILNLHERLADKLHLLALFESGEQGWSKLEAVAYGFHTRKPPAYLRRYKQNLSMPQFSLRPMTTPKPSPPSPSQFPHIPCKNCTS